MPRGIKAGQHKLTDDHRVKIKNANILNALIEHVLGKREMSATQVSAGIALMKKVLPDLQSVESKSEVTVRNVVEMPAPVKTVDEWQSTVSTQH